MIKRNKSKLIFVVICIIAIICFLWIRYLLIENSLLTNEEIQQCKQDVGLILSGKSYDKEIYNVSYTSENDVVITYVCDKTQSVQFFIKDNEIIDYRVIIDELSLILNSLFAVLSVIFIFLFVAIFVIFIFAEKFGKTQTSNNEFK